MDNNDLPLAIGTVVETGRGSLPFALIHGEPLVACATWAMEQAGLTLTELHTPWDQVVDFGEAYALHDVLCPMTPVDFLRQCVETALEREAVVVGVRPVTDTVKTTEDGALGATLDRDGLLAIASPIVLPAAVVEALDGPPGDDFVQIATTLAARFPVVTLEAPAAGRRVASEEDVRLLEALTDERSS